MHVLHVINDLSTGGAQSGLYYLLKHSRTISDFSSEVCVFHEAGTFGEKLSNEGVTVHKLGINNRFSPLIGVRIFALIKRKKYQIVHVHLFPGLYWGAILSVLFPHCKWVYTEHSVWNKRRGLLWARGLEGWAYHQYDRIVVISKSAGDSLIDWQPWLKSKLDIIPNCIDIPMFDISKDTIKQKRIDLNIDEETKLILFAGRLVKEKGVDILLQAVALLEISNWRLFIAGDGVERTNLTSLCAELNISDKVSFLGDRTDIPELIAASNLVVLPSRWEGLPLTLLEALAAGTPVVANNLGGVPEVMTNGAEGFLTPPENPQAVKDAIEKVLLNDNLARSMGMAGKIRAADYSVSSVSQQLFSMYQQLL